MLKYVVAALGCSLACTSFAHSSHPETTVTAAQFETAPIDPHIQVDQCWVRLLPAQVPSAGYLILHNNQEQPIELIAATTPQFAHTMLHKTIEVDGLSKMQHTDRIAIAAQSSVQLQPGGLHAMFEQPLTALKVGDRLQLELLFAHDKKAIAECQVQAAKSQQYQK